MKNRLSTYVGEKNNMNMKPISTTLLLLGVLMLALSAYQANQYMTTQPLVKQSLKGFDALAAQGEQSAELEQAKQSINEISSVYMQQQASTSF